MVFRALLDLPKDSPHVKKCLFGVWHSSGSSCLTGWGFAWLVSWRFEMSNKVVVCGHVELCLFALGIILADRSHSLKCWLLRPEPEPNVILAL